MELAVLVQTEKVRSMHGAEDVSTSAKHMLVNSLSTCNVEIIFHTPSAVMPPLKESELLDTCRCIACESIRVGLKGRVRYHVLSARGVESNAMRHLLHIPSNGLLLEDR